jgi:hypothetical protein
LLETFSFQKTFLCLSLSGPNLKILISDRVATGNPLTFTLTPPECHMEIRQGYGSTGTRVTGPVRVGDPLTLIVYMRSQFG